MKKKEKPKTKKPKREFVQFTIEERTKIEIRYGDGWSLRKIAESLGNNRNVSSISREIDGKPRKGMGRYQAHIAQKEALKSRKGKRTVRLKNTDILSYVKEKLKLGWSPEQISIRLPIDHKGQSISHEAIYQYVYAQIKRGGNGYVKKGCEDLRMYLCRRYRKRRAKGFRKAQKVERQTHLPSIEERPASVEKRKVFGHFEDDCIVSRQSLERLKTINERFCGLVFIGKMKDGTSEESTRVVCERMKAIPSPYRVSLTRDRGTENMGWKDVEKRLSMKVYFAHAYSSYERGSNENLNGLIRRFFPKKTDFSKVTDEEIMRVEYLINSRPRKRYGGLTPLEVLFKKTGVAINY
jgi:IS30 family transposase